MKEKRCVAPAKSLDTPHTRPAQASLTLRPARSLSRPQATFVTRLQPMRLPAQAARQLPDQSTTLRVDSSSTDDSRLGAHCQKRTLSRAVAQRARTSSLWMMYPAGLYSFA